MAEIRTEQLIKGVGEIIATHQLLRHLRTNTEEERFRMAFGATMAGLGYVYGPELQERMRAIKDARIDERMHQRILYAAGGAAVGAFFGNKLGENYAARQPANDIERIIQRSTAEIREDPTRPNGFVTILSAGFLGYSFFLNGKTPEEKNRHIWMLGSGAIGYLYGPEMVGKVKDFAITDGVERDTKALYSKGGMILGGILGGTLVYKNAPDWLGGPKTALPPAR